MSAARLMARAEARFGTAMKESATAPRLEDIKLEAPRVMAPASLPFCTSEHYDRAALPQPSLVAVPQKISRSRDPLRGPMGGTAVSCRQA
jgi:hypothetical protein